MLEKLRNHHESNESQKSSSETLSEQKETLANNKEHLKSLVEEEQKNKHEKLEHAREDIEQHAVSKEESATANQTEKQPEPVYFTRADRERSFQATMHHVRSQLNRSERILSKVIHQKQVEQISEVAGKTIARPSGLLGATSIVAIGLTIVLLIARHTGFKLSGSEFWILLCAGYIVGLSVEFIRKPFSRSANKTK